MRSRQTALVFIFAFIFLTASGMALFAETLSKEAKIMNPPVEPAMTGEPSSVTGAEVVEAELDTEEVDQDDEFEETDDSDDPVAPTPEPTVTSKAPAPVAPASETVQPAPKAVAPADPFPSGLLEITDYKYPVFLYAPRGYRPDSSYALVVIAPSEGAKAEEGIKYLKDIADSRDVFILSPHGLWTYGGDVPYKLDEWLLQVKKDVINRFPINEKKVYIAGKGTGANYAAYLSMKYPEQFAGAALLGAAWEGPFTKIMEVRSDAAGQVPFFVALRTDQPDVKTVNQIWFTRLQEKGYPLKLVEVGSEADLSAPEFKKAMFDWLDETSRRWAETVALSQKSFKAKLKTGVKNFFAI